MSVSAPKTVSGRCSECGAPLTLIDKEYPSGKPLKHPYSVCDKCGKEQKRPQKTRQKDLRKNPNEPSVFKFNQKLTRSFHYIGDDGEPTQLEISLNVPGELHIGAQYKVVKNPSIVDGKAVIIAPVSGDEISIDPKKGLEERTSHWVEADEKTGKEAHMAYSGTVKDEVENHAAIVFMQQEMLKQFNSSEIGAIVMFRKERAFMGLQEQFPDAQPFVEREMKINDPITDERLHGIIVRYGDPNAKKETIEDFPPDWKIMSELGVRTDYGRRVIVRAFGTSVERFWNLWKDADIKIEALEKFKEAEEKRLTSAPEIARDAALDMIAAVKVSVKKQIDAERQWQNNQINKIWGTMFPKAERPISDREALRSRAGGR